MLDVCGSFNTFLQIGPQTMVRLNEVIKLEEKIRGLLETAPSNYTPPICQFNCSPTKPTMPKKASAAKSKRSKKITSAPEVNTESQNVTLFDMLQSETNAASRLNPKIKTNFNSLSYGSKEIYRWVRRPQYAIIQFTILLTICRQMDPDIARLLSQELMIKYPLPSGRVGEVLGLVEFK